MPIHSKVEQQRLVAAWRASGSSAARFCSERGIPLEPFKDWVRAAACAVSQPTRSGPLQLARVTVAERVADVAVSTGPLVVEVGGARIVVGHGFDAALLTSVVAALRDGGGR